MVPTYRVTMLCSAPAEGRPGGKRFTIGNVPCYVVEPRDRATFRDQALILIPDATGVSNPEIRLLAGAVRAAVLSLIRQASQLRCSLYFAGRQDHSGCLRNATVTASIW